MESYPIPMVPGPVRVPAQVLQVFQTNFGSADLEPEFFDLYGKTEASLRKIMATHHRVVIQTGEGMLALWSALKSCLEPGDRVLCLATGIFGYGIGEMAKSIGANVTTLSYRYNETLCDPVKIYDVVKSFRPKMITAVHCETPSGTLNPLRELGALKKDLRVPLLYVDAVSSIGGTPVLVDDWNIDLCLGGAQKCLSAPPSTCFLSVSDAAWDIIRTVDYQGYDALKPFEPALVMRFFPYTPDWHGIAALYAASSLILQEGLENCFLRHQTVADFCRKGLVQIGLKLYPSPDAIPSPTVTAVYVPEPLTWTELDLRCRRHGLVVGGNIGELEGKVFRLGHMGSQADMALAEQALAVLANAL